MSNPLSAVRQIPTRVVGTTMQAARLPVDALARVTGQTENKEWPPYLAFESVEASVETAVGSLLRDAELTERGRLRQAKLSKLKQAARLETAADEERLEAAEEFTTRRQKAEQARERADESAEQRKQRIEAQAQQRQTQVAKAASQRKQTADKREAETEDALARRERDARLVAADAKAEALELEHAAVAAEDVAIAAEEQIEESKSTR